MKKLQLVFLLLLLISPGVDAKSKKNIRSAKEPVDYVDTRIGNISHLLVPTFPTSHLPNSMLRMIPTHYEFTTDRMDGFALNYPSHRQGDVLLLMPWCGPLDGFNKYAQYTYDQEESAPYRYSVFLDQHAINVSFAPSARSAIYSFTYEKEGDRIIVLRTRGHGEIVFGSNSLSGWEDYHGTKHYFYLEFDKAPVDKGYLDGSAAYVRFADSEDSVRVRYGISYISAGQAEKNLRNEIADFDLGKLAANAKRIWNETLGKIEVEGGSEDQKTVFYTALYRAHERMINISEDGRYYSAYDGRIHDDGGIAFWTDDWLWDTYLALHPLQILLNPEAQAQKLESHIRMCEQSGWMPTFPTVFGDAHCMNGNHAAGMFADALAKGIPFDVERAFAGMKNTVLNESMIPWYRGPKTELDDFYHENGWFPALHPGEEETCPHVNSFEQRQAVAVTTAASYDDWCIAQMAKKLGLEDDYAFFMERSHNYRNLYNPETGFFHPKDKDGRFIEPFDYKLSGGVGSRAYYAENNGWTYIWDVHHDIEDMITLAGSRERFVEKLDRLFTEHMGLPKWQYYAAQPDATGNVGQFVMGNEPSFHIPYLYNYAGQPWKTQKQIRMLMESWFRNDLMGIPGDEDGGGMTAFYVFSAMGFYPVSPGIPLYTIGSPVFSKVSIRLANGKTFTVIARNCSHSNKYIQSARLNDREHNQPWFTHDELMGGGTLELEMGNRPNHQWGARKHYAD